MVKVNTIISATGHEAVFLLPSSIASYRVSWLLVGISSIPAGRDYLFCDIIQVCSMKT